MSWANRGEARRGFRSGSTAASCRRGSRLEGTGEQVERMREQPRVGGRFRENRDRAGGVIEAVGGRAFDQAVDVVESASLAQPSADECAKLHGIDQVGGWSRAPDPGGRGPVQVGLPHEQRHSVVGLGVAVVLREHCAEVGLPRLRDRLRSG